MSGERGGQGLPKGHTGMPKYEFVRNGRVVERVQPVDHPEDYENTRLGVAALDAEEAAAAGTLGAEYWRVAGTELTNAVPIEADSPASEIESEQVSNTGQPDTPTDTPATSAKVRKEK